MMRTVFSLFSRLSSLPFRCLMCLVFSLLLLSSCARDLQHGYSFSDYSVSQVRVGLSRENVLLILGPPSIEGTSGNKSMYYISRRISRSLKFLPVVAEQRRVLGVHFDSAGKVLRLSRYSLKDGKRLRFSALKTSITQSKKKTK